MYLLLLILGILLIASGIVQALAPIVLVVVKTACWFFLIAVVFCLAVALLDHVHG